MTCWHALFKSSPQILLPKSDPLAVVFIFFGWPHNAISPLPWGAEISDSYTVSVFSWVVNMYSLNCWVDKDGNIEKSELQRDTNEWKHVEKQSQEMEKVLSVLVMGLLISHSRSLSPGYLEMKHCAHTHVLFSTFSLGFHLHPRLASPRLAPPHPTPTLPSPPPPPPIPLLFFFA